MDDGQLGALVRRAAGGDADALQRLIVLHHATLRAKLAGGIDTAVGRQIEAEDVLQRAYIAAFRAFGATAGSPPDRSPKRERGPADPEPTTPPHFDSPAGFYKWLERIALNELKNQQRDLRRDKRDVRREVHDARGPADLTASYSGLIQRLTADESTPSRRIARDEAVAAVLSSLARLTEEQRAVIRLRFLEGRPVPEVAAALGKTEEAVHALCYRALKELRGVLGSITNYLSHL